MIRPMSLACTAALLSVAPTRAADLPFDAPALHAYRAPVRGGGGFYAPLVPVRPAPLRYDIYGYPLPFAPPSPLAAGGCPAAVQPDYDPDGNLAGYAPVPMCR